jgi:hypothetical protein
MTTPTALQQLLDRAAITQVVQDWGLARDSGRWEQLRNCYTADGVMYTTWFVGPADEFVKRSSEAALRGSKAQHFIGAATIDIQGDKALAETRMILMTRGLVHGVEVDITCYGRFFDQFVRQPDAWRIEKRVPIYEKDRMDVLDPAAQLSLDPVLLASQPEGYRHLAYLQAQGGATIPEGLPTPRSEVLERLYAQGRAWLNS